MALLMLSNWGGMKTGDILYQDAELLRSGYDGGGNSTGTNAGMRCLIDANSRRASVSRRLELRYDAGYTDCKFWLRPGQGSWVGPTSIPASTVLTFGVAVRFRGDVGSGLFGLMNDDGGVTSGSHYGPIVLQFDNLGKINLGFNSGSNSSISTVIASSASFVAIDTTQRWYYVECQVTMDGSGYPTTTVVKVDGVTRINYTGAAFGYPLLNLMGMKFCADGGGSSAGTSYGDVYLLDNTGSVNTTFLGDCRVEVLQPSGAGNDQAWTLVAGASHTAAVSENGNDGDTSYLKTSTASAKESFALDDLNSTSGTIRGVQVQNSISKESSASRQVQGLVRVSSTNYVGGNGKAYEDIWNADYRPVRAVWDVSPATATTWTSTEVNALQAGLQLTS